MSNFKIHTIIAHHSLLYSALLSVIFYSLILLLFSPFFSLFIFPIRLPLKYSDGVWYWVLNALAFLVLVFFLAITWFKKMWILFRPINEDDPNLIELPNNPFLRYLFNTSKSVMTNAVARMLIYFVSVCVLTLSALIHLVRIKKQMPCAS